MHEAQFIEAVLRNPINREIVKRLPSLGAGDAWLVSGALFQSAWNTITRRAPDHGILDYDVFYFDPDVSWEAEDAVIRRGAELFADLGKKVEIRNQARVHLWFPQKFGMPYPPLRKSVEGIDRFLMNCAQVGIAPGAGRPEVYAPAGFADIENMIIRPNYVANFRAEAYYEKSRRWQSLWPELTVLPA
jgi:hypothetical protein